MTMTLTISDPEREFLLELLETKRIAMIHELHHTDTYDYKQLVKSKLELLEDLRTRVEALQAAGGKA